MYSKLWTDEQNQRSYADAIYNKAQAVNHLPWLWFGIIWKYNWEFKLFSFCFLQAVSLLVNVIQNDVVKIP